MGMKGFGYVRKNVTRSYGNAELRELGPKKLFLCNKWVVLCMNVCMEKCYDLPWNENNL